MRRDAITRHAQPRRFTRGGMVAGPATPNDPSKYPEGLPFIWGVTAWGTSYWSGTGRFVWGQSLWGFDKWGPGPTADFNRKRFIWGLSYWRNSYWA